MATRLLTEADGRGRRRHRLRLPHRRVLRDPRQGGDALARGAAGRLGLPASGYLFGTYENPTNAGDGYAMAYHAGAELAGLECFQINPLIKDYNGPACAYVTGPFGGYTANNAGAALHRVRLLVGPDDAGVLPRAAKAATGPVFLKLDHLAEETISEIETHPAHQRAAQPRPLPRGARHRLPPPHDRDAHLRDRLLQRPQRLGRLGRTSRRETTVPGLYAAGDMACVPHNYMLGRVRLRRHRRRKRRRLLRRASICPRIDPDAVAAEQRARAGADCGAPTGCTPHQVEYKMRRLVNDYLQPPKVTREDGDRPGAVRRDARGPRRSRRPPTRTS